MAKTRIKYQGAELSNTPITNGQKATIPCEGKVMTDDIEVISEHLNLQSKTATANGTVTYDSANFDGLKQVIVNVNPALETPAAVTPTKSQQVVEAGSEYYGLKKVTVNPIPDEYIVPSGTKTIDTVGEHDVTAYAKVNANFPLEEKTAVANGMIVASSGKFGLSKVTVAIPQYDGSGITIETLTRVIKFTIEVNGNISVYSCEEGSTWSAFVSSGYNDGNFALDSSGVLYNGDTVVYGGNDVLQSDVIGEGNGYYVR